MEQYERKNKILLIIFIICLFIISILLGFAVFKEYNNYKQNQNALKEQNNILGNITKASNKEIKKEIDNIKKTKENLDNLKKDVFLNISKLEHAIKNKTTNAKIAYLTFDDGPYYITKKYIETLNNYEIKATFFTTNVNGQNCYDNKKYNCYDLYQIYVDNGMVIGNHTYSHSIKNGLYSSPTAFINSVNKQNEHIKKYANGYETKIVRFPGGSGSAKSYGIKDEAIKLLSDNGYGWVDWTSQDGDGGILKTKEEAWEKFVATVNEPIEVIDFHDYSSISLNLLPDVIEYMQNNGYIFLPLFYESIVVNK